VFLIEELAGVLFETKDFVLARYYCEDWGGVKEGGQAKKFSML
jgi:hypothetical protein